MKIAVYGISIDVKLVSTIENMLNELHEKDCQLFIHTNLECYFSDLSFPTYFSEVKKISSCDLILSLGGDGTILEVLSLLKSNKIPVLGINTGRLGFLSNISISELSSAVSQILNNELKIEERSLIEFQDKNSLFDFPIGLNEITIHKKDSSSMISVHCYIEDEYFSTYWADGLIISTPTGSTGYSLSCGGPIITPGSGNFILTPIAPHNLNVRPLIIPDHEEICLKFEGRSEEFLLSIDSRSVSVTSDIELKIKKADYPFLLARLKEQSFSKTLRNKLMWGVDKRNK